MAEQDALIDSTTAPAETSCCCCCNPERNISHEFIHEHLKGNPLFGWWHMPKLQPWDVLDKLRDKLTDRQKFPALPAVFKEEAEMTMGYASAKEMLSLMYEATKVSGIWENVPERLRGVFWMKGNGVGEELMVLQYGRWFEKEKILITPMAPFMWAWPAGKPADAPYWGALYGQTTTMVGARILCGTGLPRPPSPATYSLKFSGEDLTYAVIQAGHDLTQDMVNVGSLIPPCSCLTCLRGKFTLELQPSTLQEPGSHWKRGIWWGPGTCTFCPFGGYNFVKVIRGDGEPNEPYYSEFLKYMDEIKLFTWSGFPDSERQSPDFRTLEEAARLRGAL